MEWIKTPEPGIHPDVPAEVYHRWDAMSASWLKRLDATSPKHFRHDRREPPRPTEAMEFGTMVHCLVQEWIDFSAKYAVAPECDRRTTKGKATWAAFQQTLGGRLPVKHQDAELARAMAREIEAHPAAKRLIAQSERELSIVWEHPGTGLRCKARIDDWLAPVVADLKTTVNAKPEAFERAIWNYGYHIQAAIYIDGMNAAAGRDDCEFVFIAVEKEPPYDVIVKPAGETVIRVGRAVYTRCLHTIKECQDTGNWPGYDDGLFNPLELPEWTLKLEGVMQGA